MKSDLISCDFSVDLIIPLYNGSRFILECLDSALNQTTSFNKIIIVDDASIDDSQSKLSNISDDRVILINNDENLGLGKSLRKGIHFSTADFICIIAQDDYFARDFLENALSQLSSETSFAHSKSINVDEDGIQKYNRKRKLDRLKILNHILGKDILWRFTFENPVSTVGIVINRNLCNSENLFQNYYYRTPNSNNVSFVKGHSEEKTWIQLAKIGNVVFLKETKTYYRLQSDSMSSQIDFADINISIYKKEVEELALLYLREKHGSFLVLLFSIFIRYPFKLYEHIRNFFSL